MTHYVCLGECEGVSDTPKNCGTEGCSLKGQPLVACSCTDGKHETVKQQKPPENEA